MNPQQIIQACQATAKSLYPDDPLQEAVYLSELLATKIREILYTKARTGVIV